MIKCRRRRSASPAAFQRKPDWEVHAGMADNSTGRDSWWRRFWMIVAWATLSMVVLMVACSPTTAPEPVVPAAPTANPTSTAALEEPTPTWEECQPFARDFHDAAHSSNVAIAELNYEVLRAALTLEHVWEQVVVDHAEAKLGSRYAKGTWAVRDANVMIDKALEDMPHGCFEYSDQWDALRAAMESPTLEQCSERRTIARDAIPERTRWLYAEEASRVLDKLEDPSSGVDTAVAYEVLGELIHADHRQLQEGAKVSLISLCGAMEWEQASAELSAVDSQR